MQKKEKRKRRLRRLLILVVILTLGYFAMKVIYRLPDISAAINPS